MILQTQYTLINSYIKCHDCSIIIVAITCVAICINLCIMFCYVTGTIAQVKVCMHCGCDISIKKLEPNMFKNLLTIPSSTSQKVTNFPYFVLMHTGISAYYSFFSLFLLLLQFQFITFKYVHFHQF